MDDRYPLATSVASTQHGAISISQLEGLAIDRATRSRWVALGLIERIGLQSYAIVGSAPTWHRAIWCAMADVAGAGFVAGRTACRLQGLDGFGSDTIEVLVTRAKRSISTPHRAASTIFPLTLADTITVGGIRCLSAHRLILEAPKFAFSRAEIENAIDSAIRLKLVSEQRLRAAVIKRHCQAINHGRALLDALVDTGGESRLERWFLGIVRRAGLPRPTLQKVWRAGSRTVARVDAHFDDRLVVELAGHGTHSSRRAIQRDEQRRTELTLLGQRVITFTHDDVRDRPGWVTDRLVEAVNLLAA
ncbi:MAG: hypothetical protein JWL72_2691 [Ilumatobacteraceae bacterium]|nr:hypothetical protein [Ilumatobacteraceae bacterium]